MNTSIMKRLEALEERLKPSIPWDIITPHLVRQMQSTCLSPEVPGGGYIETPPELMQYAEYFLYTSREEWDTLGTLGTT